MSTPTHECVCLECDGTIPCPSPACQCKWCQMPCSVCGEQLNARGYFDCHLIGKDWFCHACWRDYDNDMIDLAVGGDGYLWIRQHGQWTRVAS